MYKGFLIRKDNEIDPEILSWAKEANVWATFYLLINDENVEHMEQAFKSNRYYDSSSDQLHEENLKWITSLLRIASVEEAKDILKAEPELLNYLEEHEFRERENI